MRGGGGAGGELSGDWSSKASAFNARAFECGEDQLTLRLRGRERKVAATSAALHCVWAYPNAVSLPRFRALRLLRLRSISDCSCTVLLSLCHIMAVGMGVLRTDWKQWHTVTSGCVVTRPIVL